MKFKTTYNQYIPSQHHQNSCAPEPVKFMPSSVTCQLPQLKLVLLYDNTAGSGNILLIVACTSYQPIIIFFPSHHATSIFHRLYRPHTGQLRALS